MEKKWINIYQVGFCVRHRSYELWPPVIPVIRLLIAVAAHHPGKVNSIKKALDLRDTRPRGQGFQPHQAARQRHVRQVEPQHQKERPPGRAAGSMEHRIHRLQLDVEQSLRAKRHENGDQTRGHPDDEGHRPTLRCAAFVGRPPPSGGGVGGRGRGWGPGRRASGGWRERRLVGSDDSRREALLVPQAIEGEARS